MKTVFFYDSPLGKLGFAEQSGAIVQIAPEQCFSLSNLHQKETPLIQSAFQQITEYFNGNRKSFSFPISPQGTDFQKAVWKALQKIPYGETRSYSEIAKTIGNPKACRAVGMANHRNPILIVIPCHRVIGADQSLTGYAAGLHNKQFLLELEQKTVFQNHQIFNL